MNTPHSSPDRSARSWKTRFSLRAILVVTAVMALTAAAVANLWRAANGRPDEIGSFILFTNLAPLGLMIVVSWIYRMAKRHPG